MVYFNFKECKNVCEGEGLDPLNPYSKMSLDIAKKHSRRMQMIMNTLNEYELTGLALEKAEETYRHADEQRLKYMFDAYDMAKYSKDVESRIPGIRRYVERKIKQVDKALERERYAI